MSTFKIPPRSQPAVCPGCGLDFRTTGDELCTECRFHQENPEEAPGYWTWTQRSNGQWGGRAKWREKDPLPEPGQVITLHRKDGTTSQRTINSRPDTRYDQAANLIVTCDLLEQASPSR